jgi:hypothetical protein
MSIKYCFVDISGVLIDRDLKPYYFQYDRKSDTDVCRIDRTAKLVEKPKKYRHLDRGGGDATMPARSHANARKPAPYVRRRRYTNQ